ncbi:MAG: PEP/pyruvate-binding domain-containing protein, partial [archaeon]
MGEYIYSFKEKQPKELDILGKKGKTLAELDSMDLNVPSGFTITTKAHKEFKKENDLTEVIKEELKNYIEDLENQEGKSFGDPENPLLVSVRASPPFSMPGMMNTILNLGLNDESVKGLIKKTDERFAYDNYRRFVNMFGEVVRGIPHHKFEKEMDKIKEKRGAENDVDLDAEGMKEVTEAYKELVGDIPSDPWDQLMEATKAVYGSWDNERAIRYRELNDLPHDMDTAVNVQTMVYGNTGDNSGSGVAFTRDPYTGENEIYGEFLQNAEGEDVIAGIRTPIDISDLKEKMPEIYDELVDVCDILEEKYKDMQDLEFIVEDGELYILETRTGKRTLNAAVKIATDMHDEGLITKKEALSHFENTKYKRSGRVWKKQKDNFVVECEVASSGIITGEIVFEIEEAKTKSKNGENVILVRPDLIGHQMDHDTLQEAIDTADGILTYEGWKTNHVSVLSRNMSTPCFMSDEIEINLEEETIATEKFTLNKGEVIILNGNNGHVNLGDSLSLK